MSLVILSNFYVLLLCNLTSGDRGVTSFEYSSSLRRSVCTLLYGVGFSINMFNLLPSHRYNIIESTPMLIITQLFTFNHYFYNICVIKYIINNNVAILDDINYLYRLHSWFNYNINILKRANNIITSQIYHLIPSSIKVKKYIFHY